MRATPPSRRMSAGDPFERHHRGGAGVLGDLRLLGVDDVHDDAAPQHLRETPLDAGGTGGALVGHARSVPARLSAFGAPFATCAAAVQPPAPVVGRGDRHRIAVLQELDEGLTGCQLDLRALGIDELRHVVLGRSLPRPLHEPAAGEDPRIAPAHHHGLGPFLPRATRRLPADVVDELHDDVLRCDRRAGAGDRGLAELRAREPLRRGVPRPVDRETLLEPDVERTHRAPSRRRRIAGAVGEERRRRNRLAALREQRGPTP